MIKMSAQSSQSLPSSSSSSSGSSLATVPVENTDAEHSLEEDESDGDETPNWGLLTPLDTTHYRAFQLSRDISYRFGRNPECEYIFQKADNFLDSDGNPTTFYSNLSKVHFSIFKQIDSQSDIGFSVFIVDRSTNGTYINGELIGKGATRPLLTLSRISITAPENEAFIFINVKEENKERKQLPREFRKKYILENVELGSGANGVVRRGYVKASSRKVAVKIITKGQTLSVVKDISYEGNLMQQLEHRNIVKVIDVFENEQSVFIILEYIEGGELFEYVKSNGAIPEYQVKIWFQQLLEAVYYLHGRDIIHRDLKPENVLMTSKDEKVCEMKVTDFGLSRFVSPQSLMLTLVGTPNYLAPEILDMHEGYGKGYGRAVDCWSLGCILFIMLAGYQPFRDGEKVPLWQQIKQGSYQMFESHWKDISENAKDLVKKMLTVSSRDRITIQDALLHSWFVSEEPTSKRQKAEE